MAAAEPIVRDMIKSGAIPHVSPVERPGRAGSIGLTPGRGWVVDMHGAHDAPGDAFGCATELEATVDWVVVPVSHAIVSVYYIYILRVM